MGVMDAFIRVRLDRARAAVRRSAEQAGRSPGAGANCFEVSELREALTGLIEAVEALRVRVREDE